MNGCILFCPKIALPILVKNQILFLGRFAVMWQCYDWIVSWDVIYNSFIILTSMQMKYLTEYKEWYEENSDGTLGDRSNSDIWRGPLIHPHTLILMTRVSYTTCRRLDRCPIFVRGNGLPAFSQKVCR